MPSSQETTSDHVRIEYRGPERRSALAVRRACAGLTKAYGDGETRVVALDAVDVDIPRGRFTAIMGPSGSGKSTLMHCLAGLDTVSSGKTWVGESEITELGDKRLTRLRRDKIGFVFQAFNLLPTLTALENITLPMDIMRPHPGPGLAGPRGGDGGTGRTAHAPSHAVVRRAAAAGRRGPGPRRPSRDHLR